LSIRVAPPAAARRLDHQFRLHVRADTGGVEPREPVVEVGRGHGRGRHEPGGRGVDPRLAGGVPPAQPGHLRQRGVRPAGQPAQQQRERLVGLAAQDQVEEAELPVQGGAHRPVAVAAAEQHGHGNGPKVETCPHFRILIKDLARIRHR
jgi:hypothetical protein